MRILLQFPEGLKQGALSIAKRLEAKGHSVFLSSSPCYGACDIAFSQAKAIGAKKIIHYGHAEFPLGKTPVPVEFVESRSDADFKPVLSLALKDAEFAKCRKVGIVTTVQHVGQLKGIRAFLERHGKKVLVGRHGKLAKYNGQVLGCDAGSASSIDAKADCVLYFGGGAFHPIAVALACDKRVLSADPFSGRVSWLDDERRKHEKRRMGLLALGMQAKSFGILVSTKPGQTHLKPAEALKKRLEKAGRQAAILVADRIEPEALANFRSFDFFVNTACPRIAIDDYSGFGKPIINLSDAAELVKLLK